MPTKAQLESALRNADAAGDVAAAKQLANALKAGQFSDTQQPAAPHGAQEYGVGDYAKMAARVPVTIAKEAAKGIASIPALAGDLLVTMPMTLAQKVARMDLTPEERAYLEQVSPAPESFTSQVSRGYDEIAKTTGLYDSPETTTERYIGAAARGAGGAASGIGVGQQLAQAASPAVSAVGNVLISQPVAQAVSGASAGTGGQLAADSGSGPGGQALAALAAGVAGGMAVPRSFEPAAGVASTPRELASRAPEMRIPQRRIEPTMKEFEGLTTPEQVAQRAAESNGLKWDSLPEAVQSRFLLDADNALQVGGDLTPTQIGRASLYKSLGIKPTKALITRNVDDALKEQNLLTEEEGKALRNLYAQNNQAFRENIRQLIPEGSQPVDKATFGEQFRKPIAQGERGAQRLANRAYETAMETEGKRVAKVQDIDNFLRQNAATLEARPASAGITAELKKYGLMRDGAYGVEAPGDPFTLEKLGKARAVINDAWSTAVKQGDKRAEGRLNELRGLLNQAMDDAGGDLFKAYNQLRTAKGQRYEGNPLIDQLLKDKKGYYGTDLIEDSQVFDKAVIGSNLEQFQKVWPRLTPKAKNLTRAQVARYIEERAFGGMGTNEQGDIVASAAKLNQALDKISPAKLKLIYGEEKAGNIARLNQAVREISNPPRGTVPTGSAPKIQYYVRNLLKVVGAKIPGATYLGEKAIDITSRGQRMQDLDAAVNVMPMLPPPQQNMLLQAGRAVSPLLLPSATIQNK